MSNYLEHKGYFGTVEYSSEDRLFFGKVQFVDSLLAYDGVNVDEIETAFKETVDSYLTFCKATGRTPEKAFNGSFNVRVGCELHRKIAKTAFAQNMNLNEFIVKTLEPAVAGERRKSSQNHFHITINTSKSHELGQVTAIAGMSAPIWREISGHTQH